MAALAAISFNASALKSSLPNLTMSEQYNGKSVSDSALIAANHTGSMRFNVTSKYFDKRAPC